MLIAAMRLTSTDMNMMGKYRIYVLIQILQKMKAAE